MFCNFAEELIFVSGSRGSIYPQLIARNYLYYRYRGSNLPNEHYWKCMLYDRGICKARCTTDGTSIIYYGEHNHNPDIKKNSRRNIMNKVLVNVKKFHIASMQEFQ